MCSCTTVSLVNLTFFRNSLSSAAQCPRSARRSSFREAARQRVLVVLRPFEPMSCKPILDLSHGPALNEDNNSEDLRILEACDAFARSEVAGALQGSGLEVVGAFRDETSAVLAAPNRASPRRALLASSSPRPSVSPSSSHGARRSCKRDFAVSDASSAEHGESPSLRQHRRRREEVKFLGAHGTTTPREAWPGYEAPVPGTSSQPGCILHSYGRAAHGLSPE